MSKNQKILLAVMAAVAAIGLIVLGWYISAQRHKEDIYTQMREQAAQSQATPVETEQPDEPEEAPYVSPVDFAALQQTNPDIYAWLELPGLEIAYPVLQHPEDDSYYLNTTVDGKSGLPGSIYTEKISGKDFTGFNTVIYGHNMKNGTMFGKLKKYRDASVLEQNRDVYIYLPTEARHYRIFAAVVYSDAYLPYYYDFTTEEGCMSFAASLSETKNSASRVLDDIEITPESSLITLSTCIGGQPNNRYLVVAAYVGAE